MSSDSTTMTGEECRQLYALIDELSGGNVHHSFAWDGTDSMTEPRTRALVKLFRAAGKDVPANLKESGQ